jgi:hypothetical protein
MSLVLEKDSCPKIGYKLLLLKNGGHGVATLRMTPNSKVVATKYHVNYRGQTDEEAKKQFVLYRTNEVSVTNIESLPGDNINLTGVSLRNNCFVYKIGQVVKDNLSRTDRPDGSGIHFFTEKKFAKMWTSLLK